MNLQKLSARCAAAGDPPSEQLPAFRTRLNQSDQGFERGAHGSDMNPLLPRDPRQARSAAGVVLTLDDAGRAAALRHISQGRHGAASMPTPQGLFDSWATRPRVSQ